MKDVAVALLGAQIAAKRAGIELAAVDVAALPAAPAANVRRAAQKLSDAEMLIHRVVRDLATDEGLDDAEAVAQVGRESAARQSTKEKIAEALRTARLFLDFMWHRKAVGR